MSKKKRKNRNLTACTENLAMYEKSGFQAIGPDKKNKNYKIHQLGVLVFITLIQLRQYCTQRYTYFTWIYSCIAL